MIGFVSVVKSRRSGINMQAVLTRWSGICSQRLGVSSLNYAYVVSLVAMRAIVDGLVKGCAGNVMYHATYVGIRECAASNKLCRQGSLRSSGIDSSVSQAIPSIRDAPDVTSGSGVNSVGEGKSMMFKACCGPIPIHPRWY